MEYLLLIGGVVLVSIIAITFFLGIAGTTDSDVTATHGSSFDIVHQQLATISTSESLTGFSLDETVFFDGDGTPLGDGDILTGDDSDFDDLVDSQTIIISFNEPSDISTITLRSDPIILCSTVSQCNNICSSSNGGLIYTCNLSNVEIGEHELEVVASKKVAEKIGESPKVFSSKLLFILKKPVETPSGICYSTTGDCTTPLPPNDSENALLSNSCIDVGEGVCKIEDISYVDNGHKKQKLDVYLPIELFNSLLEENADAKLPLIFFVHGGAWIMGDKKDWSENAIDVASKGYTAVSVNYRTAPVNHWPAMSNDAEDALDWAIQNSSVYGFDSENICAIGGSAGGQLVSLLGTKPQTSSKLKCVVDYFGPVNMSSFFSAENTSLTASLLERWIMGVNFIDAPFEDGGTRYLYDAASPVNNVSSDDPSFLILHGNADTVVPLSQSKSFFKTLGLKRGQLLNNIEEEMKNNPAVLTSNNYEDVFAVFDGASHGFHIPFDDSAALAAWDYAVLFLDKNLKGDVVEYVESEVSPQNLPLEPILDSEYNAVVGINESGINVGGPILKLALSGEFIDFELNESNSQIIYALSDDEQLKTNYVDDFSFLEEINNFNESNPCPGLLNKPIDIEVTPTGEGIYLLCSRGDIKSIGDAINFGESVSFRILEKPVDLELVSANGTVTGLHVLGNKGSIRSLGEVIPLEDTSVLLSKAVDLETNGVVYFTLYKNGKIKHNNVALPNNQFYTSVEEIFTVPVQGTAVALEFLPNTSGGYVLDSSKNILPFGSANPLLPNNSDFVVDFEFLNSTSNEFYSVGYEIVDFSYTTSSEGEKDLRFALWYPNNAQEGQKFPLVVFSHGYIECGIAQKYFTGYLASKGYIVAAPDHTDAANFCYTGEGQAPLNEIIFHIKKFFSDLKAMGGFDLDNTAGFDLRYEDITATVDKVIEMNSSQTTLNGLVDEEKIGVAGHSMGGWTAIGLAGASQDYYDNRIKAAVFMAPVSKTYSPEQISNINIPVMWTVGQYDLDITQDAKSNYPYNNSPKYLLDIADAGHVTFSDLACVYGFGEKLMKPNGQCFLGDNVPAPIASYCNSCRNYLIKGSTINIYAGAFFDYYLKGKTESKEILENYNPLLFEDYLFEN